MLVAAVKQRGKILSHKQAVSALSSVLPRNRLVYSQGWINARLIGVPELNLDRNQQIVCYSLERATKIELVMMHRRIEVQKRNGGLHTIFFGPIVWYCFILLIFNSTQGVVKIYYKQWFNLVSTWDDQRTVRNLVKN